MPAITLVPQSYQYDANGNLNGMTIPLGGSYTGFTHDAEAEVTAFSAYALPGWPGATEAISHTDRGEQISETLTCPGTSSCTIPMKAQQQPRSYINGFGYIGSADIRSGQNYGNMNESASGIDYKYDASGRMTGSMSRYFEGQFVSQLGQASYTRTYDAQNHIRSQMLSSTNGAQYATVFAQCTGGTSPVPASWYPTSMSLSYWPDGHAAVVKDSNDGSNGGASAQNTFHWDDDTLLYVSSANGAGGHIVTVYLGTDAYVVRNFGKLIAEPRSL